MCKCFCLVTLCVHLQETQTCVSLVSWIAYVVPVVLCVASQSGPCYGRASRGTVADSVPVWALDNESIKHRN